MWPPLRSSVHAVAYSASFLAGMATYWWWWYVVPVEARGGVVLLASWYAMGFVASLGAGRAALLLGHQMPDVHLSLTCRALGYVGGCGVVVATPENWLEVVDLAGLLFIMLLTTGGDEHAATRHRRPAGLAAVLQVAPKWRSGWPRRGRAPSVDCSPMRPAPVPGHETSFALTRPSRPRWGPTVRPCVRAATSPARPRTGEGSARPQTSGDRWLRSQTGSRA